MQQQTPPESPRYGGPLGHALFYTLIRWFGPRPAYFILLFVIPYYAIILRTPRKWASYYLKHRFPGDSSVKRFFRTIVYYYKFGQVLIDRAAMGILGAEKFTIDFPDREKLRLLSRDEKGVVILTSHIGNWQTAMATMDHLEKSISFHLQLEEHMAGRFSFDLSGERSKVRIISPLGFMGGFLELSQALRAGQGIAIMGDRAWGARTQEHLFLGAMAAFPISPYKLALANDASLVVFLTARTKALGLRIECTYLLGGYSDCQKSDSQPSSEELLGRYVRTVEEFITRYPYMWLNFFDFWSRDKRRMESRHK